jgi:hypothetical protein
MIKQNELRVGVNVFHHGHVWTIDGMDIETWETFAHEYEPIPLTEEWLLKFGFEEFGLSIRVDVNRGDELCFYTQEKRLRYQTKGSGFTRDYNILYVHQLQNLYFALTGQELKIAK